MPSYSSQGAAVLVASATAAPACPAVVDPGDILEARIIHNGSAVGAAPSGWTLAASLPVGGGLRGGLYTKVAAGTEDGTTVNFTGQTGATTGIGYITRIVPTTGGNTLSVADDEGWADTDTSSTTFAGAGGSWTSTTSHLITHGALALAAAAGAFTASATGITVTQAGATISTTARFGTRAATNTLWYGYQTASVTTGGTGAPAFTSTIAGANAAGVGLFALILESAPASNTAPTANAGADQTVDPYATVTLNGTGSSDSDGTIASYAWTQTGGTTVTLSSSSAASPTFTAPALAAGATLTFSLVVTDNGGATSSADTVVITVLPHNEWLKTAGGLVPIRSS